MSIDKAAFFSRAKAVLGRLAKPRSVAVIALASLVAVAAASNVGMGARRAYTLWYPKARAAGSGTELRLIRTAGGVEAELEALVEELILGPMDPNLSPLALAGSGVRSVFVRGRVMYVDFSSDVLFGRRHSNGVYERPLVSPSRFLELTEMTIKRNFPSYRIVLTVEGREMEKTAPTDLTTEGK